MKLQKIENVESPKVGDFYLVKCAYIKGGAIVPVVGPPHLDKEFAPETPLHYHKDGRFGLVHEGEGIFWSVRLTNEVILASKVKELKYLKCKMLYPFGGLNNPEEHLTFSKWGEKMLGTPFKGRTCPHRGVKMVMVEGKLVCPMHNLHGCPKTQKIIGYGAIKDPHQILYQDLRDAGEDVLTIAEVYHTESKTGFRGEGIERFTQRLKRVFSTYSENFELVTVRENDVNLLSGKNIYSFFYPKINGKIVVQIHFI